ncbi:MAG: YceI family protein [Streptomycetaceae bacterium]|nr:YceI family protein [Streptomycetaceae bacterium]
MKSGRSEPASRARPMIRAASPVHGTSRPYTLTAQVAQSGPDVVTLATEFTTDRQQFGMAWSQLGMIRGLTTITASLRFLRTTA